MQSIVKNLTREQLVAHPLRQLQLWIEEATQQGIHDPNAMTLSTATLDAVPSSRTVLLKQLDEQGFTFFTNYQSRKGEELLANPSVSCTFFWRELERQVIIDGEAKKVSHQESVDYFKSRPKESQFAAWTSEMQGRVIDSRAELERIYERVEKEYEKKEVPLPPYWGGFRVRAHRVEFWQGRPHRLHDRFSYRLDGRHWVIERLTP